ncbi:MAG TPA: TonB-dependent receptor, partial [Novosphingobium sp.]|nr:TonB-dependent receptor [Novosphingobium sp.]
GPATVVGGVRVEHYRFGNSGSAQIGTALVPLEVKSTKTDFFPSLNARISLADDLVLRVAGQRGISRPAYGAIRVGSSINDTASPGTIGGGNPALKPEYTWGADASLEWYIPGGGIASVAGFHRWVDNVFYGNTQRVDSPVFNSGGVDRSGYLLSSTFNGDKGKLYGVEFNLQQQFTFLPSPLDGFGFQGNLTLLGGTFDTAVVNGLQQTGIPFPGRSKTIYNASLYYEKYGLSARVSYQWRDDWLDSLGGFGAGESRKAYGNLDVSVRYKINENFTVFADAANLTNEHYIAYEGDPNRISEVEQIGSRYMFGLRFNF